MRRTEAGRIVYDHPTTIPSQADEAKRRVTEVKGPARGHLLSVLSVFVKKHPSTDSIVCSRTSPQTMDLLTGLAADLGSAM